MDRNVRLQQSTEPLTRVACLGLFALLLGAAGGSAAAPAVPAASSELRQTMEEGGIRVTLEIEPAGPAPGLPAACQEGDPVRIRFSIGDTTSHSPLPGASPLAWMARRRPDEVPAANTDAAKVSRLRGGGLLSQPERNLNASYLLTLNGDATLSAVDAQFGFGSTKLLALVPLSGKAYDWATPRDQARVFVSIPEKQRIAVVETLHWSVEREIDPGLLPTRLALPPDDHYLWVTGGGAAQSTLVALDAATLEPAGRFAIGGGSHEISITPDSRLVFVTNGDSGSVSVIDGRNLRKLQDLPAAGGPVSVAYASLAKAVYVAQTGSGTISVLDGERLDLLTTIRAEPGLAAIAAAPDGRYLLVINRQRDSVQVIDSSVNEIVQTGSVGKAPFQIAFTRNFAYVNHLGTADVSAFPLKGLGARGAPLAGLSFPGGEHALAATREASPAARMTAAADPGALLVANPDDQEIFLYEEGMAAPRGSLTNYGHQPLAVQVIDRSLRESRAAGVYETTTTLPGAGKYDVAFFLESPRVMHCFPLTVAVDPVLEKERNAGRVAVRALPPREAPALGQDLALRFRLLDRETQMPVAGLQDVVISSFLAPGTWHVREVAHDEGDGVYSLAFAPPKAGVYYGNIQCRSRKLNFGETENLVVRVAPAGEPPETPRAE